MGRQWKMLNVKLLKIGNWEFKPQAVLGDTDDLVGGIWRIFDNYFVAYSFAKQGFTDRRFVADFALSRISLHGANNLKLLLGATSGL